MAKEIKAPSMNVIPDKKMVKDEMIMEGKNKGMREIDPRPSFSINAEEFPAIKEWSVGKKYKIEMEVEMTGCRIGEWGDDKGKMTGEFKVCGIMSDMDSDSEDEMKKGGKIKEDKPSAFPKGMTKEKK